MKDKVIKNTTMLYLMSIAKMIFPLLTLPYLTRVLTVECYGVVSYVKAIMQYMQLIVDFGFVLSGTKDIVEARNDKDRLNFEVGNILVAKLLLSVVAVAILCIATFSIDILRHNFIYTALSFVVVFMTNFLFDYLFRGLEKMEVITIRFVIMKGLATVLTFLFVRNDSDVIWIPLLDILGSFIAIILVFIEIKKLGVCLKFDSLAVVLNKVKTSATYFFSSMATTAFMALNTLLIGIYIEETSVAYWSLCLQLVTAVQAMYTPLTEGIYPHMVKTKDIKLLIKAIRIYMPIVTLGCICTFIMAKYALLILGGTQYVAAASILRALVPVLFFSFLSMLFGWPALGAIGRQKETTISTVITAFVQILGLVLLVISNNFTLLNIAILRGITEILLFVLRYRYVRKFRNEFSNI